MFKKLDNGDVIYTLTVCNTISLSKKFLSFQSTNLGEVLEKGSDYDVAVTYARFPSTSIPLRKRFADGVLTVTMNVGTDPVGYTQPLLNIDSYNGTSFLYTYRNYCDMITEALDRAFIALKVAYGGAVTSTLPPYFTFDNEFQLFRIVFPDSYITDNIHIYFNNPLQWLFSFNAIRCTPDESDPFPVNPLYPALNDYQINFSGYRVLNSTYNYSTQNYITTPNLTDFKSFILQTSMSLSPSLHGTCLNDVSTDNSGFNFVFADIEIPSVSQQGSNIYEAYDPKFHRVLDPSGIKKIDLQFFYTDTSDQIYRLPFELFFSASVTLKFRRRYHLVTTN